MGMSDNLQLLRTVVMLPPSLVGEIVDILMIAQSETWYGGSKSRTRDCSLPGSSRPTKKPDLSQAKLEPALPEAVMLDQTARFLCTVSSIGSGCALEPVSNEIQVQVYEGTLGISGQVFRRIGQLPLTRDARRSVGWL